MVYCGTRSSVRALALSASILTLTLAAGLPAMAQTWDGSDWLDGDNWVGGAVPQVPGTAYISAALPNMPRLDGDSVTIDDTFIGYSDALGGVTVTLTNGAVLTSDSATVGENSNSSPILDRAAQSAVIDVLDGST